MVLPCEGDGYIMGGSVVMRKRGLTTRTYNGVTANLFIINMGRLLAGLTHERLQRYGEWDHD
jgi:hypothetical protein